MTSLQDPRASQAHQRLPKMCQMQIYEEGLFIKVMRSQQGRNFVESKTLSTVE